MKRRHRKREMLKYAVLTAAGIILFATGARAAYIDRGRFAVGGEFLILLLPAYYKFLAQTAKEILDIFDGCGEDGND